MRRSRALCATWALILAVVLAMAANAGGQETTETTPIPQVSAERWAIAEGVIAREEAASKRLFDPSFRAKALETLAALPLDALLQAQAQESGGLGLNVLGSSQADLVYTPVTPCRILDTRVVGGVLAVGTPRSFLVTGTDYSAQGGSATGCGVPQGPATAAVVNLVAVNATGPGHLRITPFGRAIPLAAIINYTTGQTIANGPAVALCDPSGATCSRDVTIQAYGSPTHLLADVQGYFRSVATGGVGTALLADGAVTAAKIAPGAVVKSLNGQTDVVTLTGANGLSVVAGSGTVTVTSSATSASTPGTIVLRDSSGDFSAGTITATLSGSATSATGFTGSLAGEVTGTQAATFVPNAVFTNTASAIVRRDSSGGFLAGTVGLAGNLELPDTASASLGVLTKGGVPFLHNFGITNTFAGSGAGNFSLTGGSNSAFGFQALAANTTGSNNSAFGFQALASNTTATHNSAFGLAALAANTTGWYNSAFGFQALTANTTACCNSAFGFGVLGANTEGTYNSAAGFQALAANTTGEFNSAFGHQALFANTTGRENSAFGSYALFRNTTGDNNVAAGRGALHSNLTGSNNVAVGTFAGGNLASGSNNIFLGNPGVASESGVIRIGTVGTHTATYIAGISGVAPAGPTLTVVVGANGQLGTGSAAGTGDITSVNTPPGGGLQGGVTSGDANLSLVTCGTNQVLKASGAGWDCAPDADSGLTEVTGGGGITGSVTGRTLSLGSTATAANAAVAIVARDASGSFAAGTVGLAGNLDLLNTTSAGVGVLTKSGTRFLHDYGVENTFVGSHAGNFTLTGDRNSAFGFAALVATTTGALNSAFGFGALSGNTSGSENSAFGHVALNSNTEGTGNSAFGHGALASDTTGSTNSAFGSYALVSNTSGSGNSAFGHVALLSNTEGNHNSAFGLGALGATTTGSANSAFGFTALTSNTSGYDNSAFGWTALQYNTEGNSNSAFGLSALLYNTTGAWNSGIGYAALWSNTTGDHNSAFGGWALGLLSSGTWNIAVGHQAGYNLTSGDRNIYIGHYGASSESDTIRVGQQQMAAYIAGISGATSASGVAVYVDADGKLGTVTSSRRYKQQIEDMDTESDALMKLRPVSFYYRPELDETHTRQYGLVAEEVAEEVPDLVAYDKDGAPQTVRYHFVNAMLLNEVQKQRRQLEAQDERMQDQDAEIRALKAQLARLEAKLSR